MEITYDDYISEYNGIASEEFFHEVMPEAEVFINTRTMGRAEKLSPSPLLKRVEKAISVYIDSVYRGYKENRDAIERKGIKSESVLSHTVTYESFSSSQYAQESRRRAESSCLSVLMSTGLLNTSVRYRG